MPLHASIADQVDALSPPEAVQRRPLNFHHMSHGAGAHAPVRTVMPIRPAFPIRRTAAMRCLALLLASGCPLSMIAMQAA
ncbi:hypothetical protein, partial [Dyella sp.]|uniref:hypothetical protein n=1 Tax=Dyella sp. TaxID=1869338 RepID=UPI003216A6A5